MTPAPADLWQPPAGVTRATGNYIYLNSDVGDYFVAGQTTTIDSGIQLSTDSGHLQVTTGAPGYWFVEYTAQALTAIDLRFEQHCEGATPALHGAIHYVAP